MSFYLDQPSKELRFGDVVTGFQHPTVRIDSPENAFDLTISVMRPQYFVVMTPCCNIEMKSISLAPLADLRDSILKFQRLLENPTLINAPYLPKDQFTPEELQRMNPEKQAQVASLPVGYSYLECFVYEQNGVFKPYDVKRKNKTWPNLQHRMVDFKSIFRIECALIERDQDAPSGIKVSELTVETRARLRDKLTYYFGRNADEGEQ